MNESTPRGSEGTGNDRAVGARVPRWIAAGLMATVVMDIGAGITKATGLTRGLTFEVLAKWFHLVAQGNVFVADVRTADVTPLGMPFPLLIHYAIGTTFAVVFGFIARSRAWPRIPFWAPLVFGISTTLVPALFMFPAMGFGLFGQGAPPEWILFRSSLVNHMYFGLGLALATRVLFRATNKQGSGALPASRTA